MTRLSVSRNRNGYAARAPPRARVAMRSTAQGVGPDARLSAIGACLRNHRASGTSATLWNQAVSSCACSPDSRGPSCTHSPRSAQRTVPSKTTPCAVRNHHGSRCTAVPTSFSKEPKRPSGCVRTGLPNVSRVSCADQAEVSELGQAARDRGPCERSEQLGGEPRRLGGRQLRALVGRRS
jgi:hypothetical protein